MTARSSAASSAPRTYYAFASPAIACSAPGLSVHVHVLGDGDQGADRYLTFRDRLRSSPADRMAYERLKRDLARRDWAEIGLYADAKGPLIEAILARARQPRT